MVRRIKEDLRVIQGGFPQRHVPQVKIDRLPAHWVYSSATDP